jgi:DNA-3-methyladenine glycosylase I
MSYCSFCQTRDESDVHRLYHDTEYGFPLHDDDAIFGRLLLEINQAGLSWDTILRKKANFFNAYDSFSIAKIANYSDDKIQTLLNDKGIVRHKLKIHAAIYNAQQICEIQKEFSTFKHWLDTHSGKNEQEWTQLFKETFKFVGKEIVTEFLMSIGYLKGAHEESCSILGKIDLEKPRWRR